MPFHSVKKTMNILFFSFFTISLFFLSACTSMEAEQVAEIKQLKSELDNFKKQLVIINRNQQAIAKKIGLASSAQPTIKVGNSASLGAKNAPLVLLEFTDLHCPYCKKFALNTFPQLMEKYIEKGQLRFVGKHLPIPQLHPNAFFASQLLECSRAQSDDSVGYEKAKNWLFAQGNHFDKSQTEKFTTALKLDNSAVISCLADEKIVKQIKTDMLLAKKLGIKSTPSFVIGLHKNGHITDWKIITGAKTAAQFSQAIDGYLTKVK